MVNEGLTGKPLVIIGNEDTVGGFKALGFKVYPIKEHQDLKAIFDEVVQAQCAACLVEENIYLRAQDVVNSYKDLTLPIFIPFSKDAKNLLLESIVKDIKLRATGTN
ncbi:MAG: V-type ATP synthase subunit F [Candidatus Omnitrophica bacterium]|nr:V-type ATP synthase subunit F [Candidatus Omnitrophota bacterium]